MTDAELVQRITDGDRTAVATVLASHEAPLLRFAGALLGDAALAQDAVQEAFLRLMSGGRGRDVQAIFPWLLHVTRNICLDLRRKETRMERKHEAAAVMAPPEAVKGADAATLDVELRDRVRDAVGRLPEKQREVLRLKLWEGLTYREIAERLEMTLTNVSYHLGQAVKAVGGRLREAGLVGDEQRRQG